MRTMRCPSCLAARRAISPVVGSDAEPGVPRLGKRMHFACNSDLRD